MSTFNFDSIPHVALSEINFSTPEFWLKDRAFREGAFKTLRDESPFQYFEEAVIEGSPFPRALATEQSPAMTTSGMSAVTRNCSAAVKAQILATYQRR